MIDWRQKMNTISSRSADKTGNGIADAGIFQGLVDSASGETQSVRVVFANGNATSRFPCRLTPRPLGSEASLKAGSRHS
jgi:hypothetical protein